MDLDELLPPYDEASAEDSDEFEVWPEHWEAVRLFGACDDQWRVLLGFSGAYYQGLNMEAVEVVRGWLGIERSETLFRQLREMVSEARQILNS